VLASAIAWLDAFTTNVDRTARNPNLLATLEDAAEEGPFTRRVPRRLSPTVAAQPG